MRCPSCGGTGHLNGHRRRDDDCLECSGSGEVCLECGESAPYGDQFCERHRSLIPRKSDAEPQPPDWSYSGDAEDLV